MDSWPVIRWKTWPTRVESARSLAEGANAALDRDLTARFSHAMQRSLFPEALSADPFSSLAQEVTQGGARVASPRLRRRILLRASRMAAIRGQVSEAQTLLAAGAALSGEESDLPAKARLAQAEGHVDAAIKRRGRVLLLGR
jgi:hypothetical protein